MVLLLVSLALGAACRPGDITRATQATHGIVVAPGDSGRLYLIDTGFTSVRTVPLGSMATLAAVAAPDRETLYLSLLRAGDQKRELVAVAPGSGTVLWREPVSGSGEVRRVDGIQIWGDALAITPDGSRFVLGYAIRDSTTGVALLDVSTRATATFAGPFVSRGVTALASSPLFPRGVIAVMGARVQSERVNTVFLLDPHTLDLLDSLPPSVFAPDTVRGIVASNTPDVVLGVTGSRILRVAVSAHRIIGSAPAPSIGSLVVNESTAVLTDAGTWPDSPGSGRVYFLDPSSLSLEGSLQLLAPDNGQPRVSRDAATGFAPDVFYVTTGTAFRGPSYGTQPPGVFAIDVPSRAIRHFIPIPDWNTVFAFAF